jgi:sec-independent protein translocase protein TatA
MGGASIWHWIIVGIVVMLLFGRGKISEMMSDVAKGIKAFKKGMSEEDEAAAPKPVQPAATEPVRTIEHQSAASTAPGATTPLGERKAG